MKVVMTGGGTGGHIYPAIAIADEIKRRYPDLEIVFIGAEIGMETTIVPDNGYEIILITADGFSREHMSRNFKVLLRFGKGTLQARNILRKLRPDVVIGTGGYASAPVVRMAQSLNIPTYIQEQNAIPGVTNKFLESRATKVFLGFEKGSQYFKHKEKHVVSGNPVRKNFTSVNRDEAREELGFKPKDFVLLSFGGSQGAGRINKAMMEVVETFNGVKDLKICMATGGYYYKAILEELEEKGIQLESNISIIEYIKDMAKYLTAADLVVGRSGALSVAEITMCGKPAIFIPSPIVSGNHQYYNAVAIEEKGGAKVIEEKDLEGKALSSEILKLKNNPEILRDMSEKSAKCAPLRAAEIICDSIEF
ncbi:MAG: undecaprenyldiphospho-muramoylpentapeptide beta-N-acetylglucosaminyltransferase [Clostridiales bacterium]|nr:undecaprenyldiphospho-muramoylpentapeptide beta-N-acetylglucosaminyltransferase [Clostridiales bacterium]